MKRRGALAAALGAALLGLPLAISAQQARDVARIGILVPATRAGWASRIEAFRAGMREHGYIEGQNFTLELRSVENEYHRLPALAGELAGLKVDVIITGGTNGALAAKQATAVIPIVVAVISDPVATGVVPSLARPGGNVTGLMFFVQELNAKRLEILREAMPGMARVAALMHADNVSMPPVQQAMIAAAKSLGVELRRFDVRRPEDFGAAFAAMGEWGAHAVIIVEDPMLNVNAAALGAIASARGMPSIGMAEIAAGGGLMGYGVDQHAMFRRAAYYVSRLLKGVKAADLPVERSSKFEFAVNLKAARAMGIAIPQSMLLRADRVIE